MMKRIRAAYTRRATRDLCLQVLAYFLHTAPDHAGRALLVRIGLAGRELSFEFAQDLAL